MQDIFSLKGKNIMITGASSGIGRQCAIECSKSGARIVLVARNQEKLEETKVSLTTNRHLIFSQDITCFDKIEPLVSEAVSVIGKIDGFIHAAGIEKTLPLMNMKYSDYEEIMKINHIAGFEIARHLAKAKYRNTERASWVFIASTMGVVGNAGLIGYSSSKGALISGVRSLAIELADKKINVNTISPGMVMTKMMEKHLQTLSSEQLEKRYKRYPLGIGSPQDVAYACIYLLSDAAKWVTGTNLVVDGGFCAR